MSPPHGMDARRHAPAAERNRAEQCEELRQHAVDAANAVASGDLNFQIDDRGSDEAARDLAARLPSRHSKDYGRSFAEIFKAVEYDFYKIDPALFAPAEVWVSNLDSGSSFHGGALNMELLRRLWLKEA